jgi:large subunit ribosomal protein L20
MVKINFANARHKRRKKVLKLAKGYFGSKSTLYKTAHEQVMRSLQYAYRDRRQKKRNFRKLWITRINAGCSNYNVKYSRFIHGLSLANVDINRKILADIAFLQPEMFKKYIDLSQFYLNQKQNIKEKISKKKEFSLDLNLNNKKNDNLNKLEIITKKKEDEKKQENIEENNKNKKINKKIDKMKYGADEKNNIFEKKIKLIQKNKELENMLLTDLKQLAKEKKVKNYSKCKKTELIEILKKI